MSNINNHCKSLLRTTFQGRHLSLIFTESHCTINLKIILKLIWSPLIYHVNYNLDEMVSKSFTFKVEVYRLSIVQRDGQNSTYSVLDGSHLFFFIYRIQWGSNYARGHV